MCYYHLSHSQGGLGMGLNSEHTANPSHWMVSVWRRSQWTRTESPAVCQGQAPSGNGPGPPPGSLLRLLWVPPSNTQAWCPNQMAPVGVVWLYNTASIESEVQLGVYLNDIIHYSYMHILGGWSFWCCYLGNTTVQERYILMCCLGNRLQWYFSVITIELW